MAENFNLLLVNRFVLLEGDECENLTVEATDPPPSSALEKKRKGNRKKALASSSIQLRVDDGNGKKGFSSKPQGSFYHGKGRGHDLERQNGNGRSNGVRPNNNQLGGRSGHDLERRNGNGRINGVSPNNKVGGSNFKQINGYNASKKPEKEVLNGESEGEGWQVVRRRNTRKKENGSRRNYGPPSSSKSNYGPPSRTSFANRRDQNFEKVNKNVTMDKNGNKKWTSSGTQRVKQMDQTVRRGRDKFRNEDAKPKPPSYEDLFEFPPLLPS